MNCMQNWLRRIKYLLLQLYFFIRLPFILAVRMLFKPRGGSNKIDKILLIRLDRLGDFILSLPVIDNMKLKYPEAKIDILVRPYLSELSGMIKGINKLVVYKNMFISCIFLRKQRYDLAIDLLCDYKLKSALIAYLCAAPRRVGFKQGSRDLFFSHPVESKGHKHMVDLTLGLLKPLDIPIRIVIPKIDIAMGHFNKTKAVVIHPGGYYPSQRWGRDRFSQLIASLYLRYKCEIIVVGDKSQKRLVDYIVDKSGVNARPLCLNLKDLVFTIANCSLFIGNNSGPLHLAASLGIPTISTMGPTDPVLWWPRGEGHVVIRKDISCSPCLKASCREQICMDKIEVGELMQAAAKILDKSHGISKN
ncbi:MAG: glycosyltransferase family 9 protein [Candidatus Omnitrophota bacterium]